MFKLGKQTNQAKRKLPATQPRPPRWRKSYNWLLLSIPLILTSVYLLRTDQVLPIRTIQLAGTFVHLDQGEVESTLQPYLGQGFFSLDIHQLQKILHAKPWTQSVSIRRIWPDKLLVTIVEKKPVARWDEQHLLSDRARVFRADTTEFASLPLVHADNHPAPWVLDRFYRLQARFDSVDESLIALRVDSRGALDLELINDLVIKLGRTDIEHKIDRLVNIYPQQILPRRDLIRRLDLRYSNGFAVSWKAEALKASDEASIWSNSNV